MDVSVWSLALVGFGVFLVGSVGGGVIVSILLVRLPAGYFRRDRPRDLWVDRHPLVRWIDAWRRHLGHSRHSDVRWRWPRGTRPNLGRISELLAETTALETSLSRRLATLAIWITTAIVVVALLIFGIGLLREYSVVDSLLAGITLAVAAIPEGLFAAITIASAIGVRRMARRHAIIRQATPTRDQPYALGGDAGYPEYRSWLLTRGALRWRVRQNPAERPAGEAEHERPACEHEHDRARRHRATSCAAVRSARPARSS